MLETAEMRSFEFRPLITDTLPYEVPVIFSNDMMFRTLGTVLDDAGLNNVLSKLNTASTSFTIPYQYNIRKSRHSSTTLSIVHPQTQICAVNFYNRHSEAILAACSRSQFSLRHPTGIAQRYTDFIRDDSSKLKSGIVQQDAEPADGEISHVISYFSYSRFNLLGKFFESREFLALEKSFGRLRTLDVSKCFFNIYTHSVTWAIKNKKFSKENVNSYSFEAEFDRLMQWANYNETNGIVIGPEVSRVFAEIILQAIDRSLSKKLEDDGLVETRDYAIRRYVDDFFIFANTDECLDRIEKLLRAELEAFKLFVNENKLTTISRPYVTRLTLARTEIHNLIRPLWSIFTSDDGSPAFTKKRDSLADDVKQIRLIIAKHEVEFSNISGYLLTAIRNLIRATVYVPSSDPDKVVAAGMFKLLRSLIETAFYICAVDLRVRSTYSVCQIILFAKKNIDLLPREYGEQLDQIIIEELELLVRTSLARVDWQHVHPDSVELFNLLICGAEFIGRPFLELPTVREALSKVFEKCKTYFGITAVKFCLLKDGSQRPFLDIINAHIKARILKNTPTWQRDTELYLLLCDYLGAPDIAVVDKRTVCNAVLKGSVSQASATLFSEHIGFIDWNGTSVEHILRRKELRPAYG